MHFYSQWCYSLILWVLLILSKGVSAYIVLIETNMGKLSFYCRLFEAELCHHLCLLVQQTFLLSRLWGGKPIWKHCSLLSIFQQVKLEKHSLLGIFGDHLTGNRISTISRYASTLFTLPLPLRYFWTWNRHLPAFGSRSGRCLGVHIHFSQFY